MEEDTDCLLPPEDNIVNVITPNVRVINGERSAYVRRDGYGAVTDQAEDPSGEEVSVSGGDGEEKKAPFMTRRQKFTFAGIALTYLASLASFSVLAPFFPYEAEKKGVTSTQTGFVFGLFALVNFVASPLLGKYLPVIGAKFMFLSGSFVGAGCNLLFGFLDGIYGTTMFLSYCFVIRFVEGVASAATITAGMAIVAHSYPDNVAQMGGMLELFSGLGFAVGPPLGSLFYGLGGYRLPFIVLGSGAMIVAILNVFILPGPKSEAQDEKVGSLLSVARIPAVWVVLIACMWGSACLGFCDPTLALHITSPPLNVAPGMVGYLFLLIGGLYGATAPIWGYIADKKKTTRIMMTLGFYFTGISYLLMGPSPLLHLPSKVWLIILALGLQGFSIGIAIMPAFLDLLVTSKWYGLPDDLSTQAIISGVFNSAFCFGTFLGPTVAGTLVDRYGFDWSATMFAMGNFVVMIMLSLFGIWEYQWGRGRRRPKPSLRELYPEIQENGASVDS